MPFNCMWNYFRILSHCDIFCRKIQCLLPADWMLVISYHRVTVSLTSFRGNNVRLELSAICWWLHHNILMLNIKNTHFLESSSFYHSTLVYSTIKFNKTPSKRNHEKNRTGFSGKHQNVRRPSLNKIKRFLVNVWQCTEAQINHFSCMYAW
jgi:hypothetical protein